MTIEILSPDKLQSDGPGEVLPAPADVFWHTGAVTRHRRAEQFGHRPATLWLTGLSGAGKSTIAYALEATLLADGHPCYVLDGDNLRHHLNRDLGFSAAERRENIRRSAEVAKLMNEAGLIVLASFISPLREDRAMARAIVGNECFVEVHVSTPLEVCAKRDPKGLYAKARSGQITGFTGISAPYEPPRDPDIVLDGGNMQVQDAAHKLYRHLAQRFL